MYLVLNQSNFNYTKVCEVCGENYYTNTKKARCCNNGYCSGSLGILSPLSKGFDPDSFKKVKCKQCEAIFTMGINGSNVYCSDTCKCIADDKRLELTMEKVEKEFVGQKFGKVTVDYLTREFRDGKPKSIVAYYTCECGGNGSCRADILRDAVARSCGCLITAFTLGDHGLPQFLRRKIRQWIIDSRNNYEGLCDITGIGENNAIHHLYPFANIVLESLDISGLPIMEPSEYTKDELRHLTKVFLELHNEYPAGICVSEGLHQLFHSIYGSVEFTPDDYYEFKGRCTNGEFGELSEYNRSKRRDDGEVKYCHYCNTTDGYITGRNGKLGENYCQKHYKQMVSKGYCSEDIIEYPNIIQVNKDTLEITMFDMDGNNIGKAVVDAKYHDVINEYKWKLDKDGYVVSCGKGSIKLNTLVSNHPKGTRLSYINNDKLDNRECNFEMYKYKSGYPGVSWWGHGNKWHPMMTINGKRTSLGYYDELQDAIDAHKDAVLRHA